MQGFLNIDKPKGITSHDVVNKVRWMLKSRGLKNLKVGHAGTLDPLATGVLVVCVGAASRLSEYVMGHEKTYRAVVQFGVETDTYDAEGETVATVDASHLTQEALRAALSPFIGDITQIPPMHSAIKKDGKKLYDLARAGVTIEREPRPVTIRRIELDNWDGHTPDKPQAVLEITCGSGTYIRSLAHDLGEVLGVGAHLTGLSRTRSGAFRLSDSVTLDALAALVDWSGVLVNLRDGLGHNWPVIPLDGAALDDVLQGRAIDMPADVTPVPDETLGLGLSAPDDVLRAVLRAEGGRWHPKKVFHGDES